ncbi:MAG: protein kinase domain-containing protein [Caldimonas sp.]
MKFDARDWPVISALFDQALDVPASSRRRWLEELPEDQRLHRDSLERLLADHASVQTEDFLSTLPKRGTACEPMAAPPDRGGQTVGPYRLLRELGRGGMGRVWLAERSDGLLKRQVALKLPHPGLATRAFADRLARERDILASLAHPHIARLYDAGVTPEGQPYIALAYVSGLTLTEHCRARALGVRERVGLFRQVLDAVQYAHAHLVIHRDLKPSNVLVDEQGQVHLLDFGIAKLLVDGQAEPTELTLDGGQALTLDYASPEQIAGGAVSTASDVYSLGVLLYELLAGVRPYRLQRQGPTAMAQALREIDVPGPSAAARGAGNVAESRLLRGDLDTIVLKALKREPSDRYATADAFSQDLLRYLDGAPVLARPDAMSYRVGKFVRRHRFGVAATALLVLALGTGLAGTVWQARLATRQAERAEAVQGFLISLFDEADPVRAQGRELTALGMLDRGQRDLQSKLADQPRLKAHLNGVLAALYDKLDKDEKALPLAEARRDLTLRLDGPSSLEYGDALYQLADVQGALDHEKGYRLFQQARQVLARYASVRSGELLRIEGSMAYQLGAMGRFKESAEVLRAALPEMQAHFGPRSWEVVHNKGLLLYADTQTGDFRDAANLVREIEPLLDGVGDEHVLDMAVVRGNVAMAELQMWRPEEAEALIRRTVSDFERLLGPDTPSALGGRRLLAEALEERGQFGLAARAYEDVAQHAARVLGENSRLTRISESASVESLILVGRSADAEVMARRSLQRSAGSPESPGREQAAIFENRLGLALVFNGKANEAAALLEAGAEQARREGHDTGDDYGRTLLYLAGARLAQGRADDAAQAASQAASVLAASPRGADMFVARAQLTEALALAQAGQPGRAEPLIALAQEHLQKVTKPDHPVHLLVQLVHARAMRAAGRPAEADRVESDARVRLKETAGAVLPRDIPLVF